MRVTKVTKKSRRYNEDAVFTKKNLYVVMDGASSLYPVTSSVSDASKFVKYIKEGLKKYDGGNLLAFLKCLGSDYYQEEKILDEIPSCGMALCEITDEYITIYNIGDVEVCVITKEEKILLKQKELEVLDNYVLETMKEIAQKENIDIVSSRKKVNDLLIEHRHLMNKEKGYAVYTPEKNQNLKFSKRKFLKEEVLGVFLATDGYYSAYKVFNIYNDYRELYDLDVDIKEVVKKIVEVSDSDALCNQYPRFKKRDDLSAIKIDLRNC